MYNLTINNVNKKTTLDLFQPRKRLLQESIMLVIVIFLHYFSTVLSNITSIDLNKCKITHKGTEYIGKTFKTETNVTCQYWSSSTQKVRESFISEESNPIEHSEEKGESMNKSFHLIIGSKLLEDEAFPDGSKILAKNYCRNPNKNPKGPWCYTAHKNLIYDTCNVPLCKVQDCRISGPGMEYSGSIEKSVTGKKCTKWKEKHHLKKFSKETAFKDKFFSDGTIDQAGRKCRNPDGSLSGPWCYVERDDSDLHAKELCDIPFCDDIGYLMYSEGSVSGNYFFFSSINESQSLNISFRLWDPGNWLHGKLFLFLGAYDIATEREDISRWNSGIEIKLTHNGSGIISEGEDSFSKTPLILSGAAWTNLEIVWTNADNESLLIQVFQKPKIKPIALTEILISNTVFQFETFRYISFGGSPAFWDLPSATEDCPVHTVTQTNFTRFWLIKKTMLGKDIEIFIRAKKEADIILRKAPMNESNQVQISITSIDKIRIFTFNSKSQSQHLNEVLWDNVLTFWKWEYFKIALFKDKMQLFWVRDAVTSLLLETSHENIEAAMWVSFSSPVVSYWSIYCDPRGVSDPPPAAPPECVSQDTEAFNGTLSITRSGRQCIPWTDVNSLPEKYHDEQLFKSYGGRAACENFCRNFDSDPKGAYCIVRDRNSESGFGLEHCHPRSCSLEDCKLAGTGNDYIGQINITRSKRKCKIWTEIQDKVVDVVNFPDPTLKDAGNFCRNPSKIAAGTWCFTNDTRVPRDLCYIKDCDKPLECTILTSGFKEGTFFFILPRWRKYGLHFWLKAWNPDIYEGLLIALYSLDRSKEYRLLIGDENNEKLKLFYKDHKSKTLLSQKTLPHLIPSGKWKGYWLKTSLGEIELGYDGVPTSFFKWTSTKNELSLEPMLLNFGTIKSHWIGVNFYCTECLTIQTTTQDGYNIYPINLWREDISTSKLQISLRGSGSALVTLLWTQDFKKLLGIQFVPNSVHVLIVKFTGDSKEILAKFTVSSTMTEYEWSEFIISFSENNLKLLKGTIQLFEWTSPIPLLIYWFSITADNGAVSWTANCPAPDIDGEPRDGSWGKWGPWTCSVTCGKGEGKIERACNDPPPNVYGKECKGSPVYEGPCNDFPCGKISPNTLTTIRHHLSSQHKSLQVDVSERVVLNCNPQAVSLISAEVNEMNITWTHNGFPYSRTRFHMDENFSLVIPRAQEKHCGIYLCLAYQDPDSIPSKIVLDVISLVVIKQKPTKKVRKGKSLTLKCNGLALSYVYGDLSHRWELNGTLWKDYGLGNLQTYTVDKLENISDSHAGIWTCVVIQEDFKFKWTTNWLYLKVKSAPSFWSHLMEDVATAPLFGKLGNERNAMILFFTLIGAATGIILLVVVVLVKWLK